LPESIGWRPPPPGLNSMVPLRAEILRAALDFGETFEG
jgi:hypothetical protein